MTKGVEGDWTRDNDIKHFQGSVLFPLPSYVVHSLSITLAAQPRTPSYPLNP